MKFFLNSNASSYLRELETEFGESTNAIRMELNRFEKAGFLKSHTKGNKKLYQANTDHPLFSAINNLLLKYVGFDKIIENVIHKLGDIQFVYIVGEFARGVASYIIDLVFVCESIDREYLARLVEKVENLINRKVRYLILNNNEFEQYATMHGVEEVLLLWKE